MSLLLPLINTANHVEQAQKNKTLLSYIEKQGLGQINPCSLLIEVKTNYSKT